MQRRGAISAIVCLLAAWLAGGATAIDGFLGLKTRQAVKAMQVKYNLPADSYPTAELLAGMWGGH